MSTKQTSPLATTEQLRAAFAAVLAAARDRAIQEQRAAHQSKMAAQALEPAWKAKLEEALPGIENAALQSGNFSGDVLATWVDQAMEDYSKNNLRLTTNDLQKPHPSLWRIGGAAAVWKKTKPKAFDAWTEKFIAALDKVVALQAISDEQLALLKKELESYGERVLALEKKVAAVRDDPGLAAVQEPMTAYVEQSVLDPARMVIKANRPETVLASLLSARLDEINRDELKQTLANAVSVVRVSATGFADSALPHDGIAALAARATKPAVPKMVEIFGVAAYFALASMKPSDMDRFMNLYFGMSAKAAFFQPAFNDLKLSHGCAAESILTCINAALAVCSNEINDKDRDEALRVIMELGPTVPMPKSVDKTFGMTKINNLLIPTTFATKQFITEERCLKHVPQEVGEKENPTKEKLKMYLAEMVAACESARIKWIDQGRPTYTESQPRTVVQHAEWRAVWKFCFEQAPAGKKPSTVVYHIDSGFEQSPWIRFSPESS